MSDPFIHDEDSLAARFGVDRAVIREMRGQRGVDVTRGEHGRYLWTENAVAALAAKIGVAVPTMEKQVRTLHVAYTALPMPIQMACVSDYEKRADRREWVIVRVNPHLRTLFMPGMKISAEHMPDNSWRYIGPENCTAALPVYPRSRGRW